MSQAPQKLTWTADKPQQTDCLDLTFVFWCRKKCQLKAKKNQLTILQKSMRHIYSCSTLACFHLLPPSLGMFVQAKEVRPAKKQHIDLAVGWFRGNRNCRGRWQEIQISSLTSLYECGSRFRAEEKSAAISLIPPRGPRPQTLDGNVRSIRPGRGEPFFLAMLLLPLGKL